jgi:hypothetical protein
VDSTGIRPSASNHARSDRGGGDLLDKPFGAEDGGEFGLEDLERDLTLVLQVLGQIDGGHPALPELALDPVAVGDGGADSGLVHAHWGMTSATNTSLWRSTKVK